MNTAKTVKNSVNSIFVKGLIVSKGWTKQQAANHIIDFVTSGTKISFYDFMLNAD